MPWKCSVKILLIYRIFSLFFPFNFRLSCEKKENYNLRHHIPDQLTVPQIFFFLFWRLPLASHWDLVAAVTMWNMFFLCCQLQTISRNEKNYERHLGTHKLFDRSNINFTTFTLANTNKFPITQFLTFLTLTWLMKKVYFAFAGKCLNFDLHISIKHWCLQWCWSC